MAHIDAGKTTTSERILFYSGVSQRLGEVHDGSTVMDWMEQEQERGISITAAATTLQWDDHQINLIDTPGHVDFTIEVERSLRVLDGVIAVFCAVGGVEPQSETVWRQADRYRVPRVAFINKCDRTGADPDAVVQGMRQRLAAHPIVLQIPCVLQHDFDGIIDLIEMTARTWDADSLGIQFSDAAIPSQHLDRALAARSAMLDALADIDDAFMERLLGPTEPAAEEIHAALRRATLDLRAVPVLVGAAFKNKGIHSLLDAVVRYLPSPADVSAVSGVDPTSGQPESRRCSEDAPLAALAFKIASDPVVGALTYFRVYSGCLRTGDSVLNASKGKRERIGRIVRMHANMREEIKEISAGDIGAAIGLRTATTGDTLTDPAAPISLETIKAPAPVIGVALEPETPQDYDALADALEKLAAEDPSFRVHVDGDSLQTVVSGMGELHLEIIADRLRREFHVNVRIGRPRVAYRETVLGRGEGEARYAKQVGLRGQYAHVRLVVEPRERGAGVLFESAVAADAIPKEYVPAVQAGVEEAVERGVVAGFSMVDLKVSLVDGSHHEVDSSDIAFKMAGSLAFKDAAGRAGVAILEPVMAIEVVTPEESLGEVIGDFNARRGKITGIEARSSVQVIAGLVPLATMFGYATDLRSRTQGRATYSMQFDHYAEVPSGIREEVAAKVGA